MTRTTITTAAILAAPRLAHAHGGHGDGSAHAHGYGLAACIALAVAVFLLAYWTDRTRGE